MTNKLVVLKLVGLRYSGESIGDDLTVEAVLAGKVVSINKKLELGQTAGLNTEIGQFVTNQSTFSVSGVIRIIERDPVFNDSGETHVSFKIDLREPSAQRSTHQIEVVEAAGPFGGAVAVFDVTLEALVLQATRFVADDGDGWLRVTMEDTTGKVPLPAAIKVEISHLDRKHEYFTIVEGAYRGRSASVKLNSDGSSRLSAINPQVGPAKLVYSIAKKTLKLKGKTYQTQDDPSTPWAKGLYDVEIPDAPHRGGLNYPQLRRAKTWFRVGHQGDRYIHTGRNSLGCITVTEQGRWDELCAMLIAARKGDGVSIGTLQVVD